MHSSTPKLPVAFFWLPIPGWEKTSARHWLSAFRKHCKKKYAGRVRPTIAQRIGAPPLSFGERGWGFCGPALQQTVSAFLPFSGIGASAGRATKKNLRLCPLHMAENKHSRNALAHQNGTARGRPFHHPFRQSFFL